MSKFSKPPFVDNGISDKIYELSEDILGIKGSKGVNNVLSDLRHFDIMTVLSELYDNGRGYGVAKNLMDSLSNLSHDIQYGYKGTFISRLEVLKAEKHLDIDDYPYKLQENLTHGQQAMLDAYDGLFNAELLAFRENQVRGFMHLGKPLALLRTVGIRSEEILVSPRVLNQHLKLHGLQVEDLRGLARAIQTPILVYNHGIDSPNKVVVSDLFVKGGKLSVSLELDEDGNVVELNNVRSIHQKDAVEEINRLHLLGDELKDFLCWVEKEKVMDWFSPAGLSSLIQASNPKLISVAKVLNNFENPTILSGKFLLFDGLLTKNNINAIIERATNRSANACFTSLQRESFLNAFSIFGDDMELKKEGVDHLISVCKRDKRLRLTPEKWIDATKSELLDVLSGKVREEQNKGLKR